MAKNFDCALVRNAEAPAFITFWTYPERSDRRFERIDVCSNHPNRAPAAMYHQHGLLDCGASAALLVLLPRPAGAGLVAPDLGSLAPRCWLAPHSCRLP